MYVHDIHTYIHTYIHTCHVYLNMYVCVLSCTSIKNVFKNDKNVSSQYTYIHVPHVHMYVCMYVPVCTVCNVPSISLQSFEGHETFYM